MNLQINPDAPMIVHLAAGAILILHIAGGSIGIVAGFTAILARKGGRLHSVAGTVFFAAMMTMATIAAAVSPLLNEEQWTNTTAGVFTLYLLTTSWMTVRRRPGQIGRFEVGAAVIPVSIVVMAVGLAIRFAGRSAPEDLATVYAIAVISALAATCDLAMIRRGGLAGPARIARHLWRMSASLFVATGSFFLGQQKFLPEAVRDTFIPAIPVLAVLALLIFWMVRVRFSRAFRPRALAAAALCLIVAMSAALAGGDADARPYRAPRTSHGAPDLQGTWTNSSVTMLQRPPIFKNLVATDKEAAMMEGGFKKMVDSLISTAPIDPNLPAPSVIDEVGNSDVLEMDMRLARIDGQMRTSWIVEPADGRIPFTDEGRKAAKAARADTLNDPEGRPLEERCLTAIGSPEGPPMMNTAFNAHYQILQTRSFVVINIEMNHDVRIIRLGDRTHLPEAIRPWMGDSVGWWEGDTLVVETTNFDPASARVSSLGGGFVWSAKGKLTERFTRVADDRILYAFTVDDPVNFKQPWRAEMPMRAAKGPIYEYACHEGNYSLPNVLAGAREEERGAAAAPGTK